jgi:septal ring factor EnvC (AmiA/AmiB activator)
MILVCTLACTLTCQSVLAEKDKTAHLEQLRQEISHIRTRLNQDQSSLKTHHSALQALEKEYAAVATRLRELRSKQSIENDKLTHLQKEHHNQKARLALQKEALEAHLVSAWKSGRQASLKILFGQNSPSTVSRTMTYYRYLNQQRTTVIQETQTHLQQLEALEEAIQIKQARLSEIAAQTEQTLNQLQVKRGDRQQLVSKIRSQIEQNKSRLSTLQEDEKRVEGLLQELQNLLADIPEDAGETLPFSSLKGKLPWPAQGKPKRAPHSTSTSSARFNGVLIPGEEGAPIRSIAAGRVVFSDWFRGMGLLVIIDHGDEFMSLYGHNQSLLVSVGQWVGANEHIATLGNSGGNDHSALYFEIRSKGRPQNPLLWCTRQTARK